MYKIVYNSNPNHPKHLNHIGAFSQLTEQDSRSFDDLDEAINFWFSCNSTITKLIEFMDDFKKKLAAGEHQAVNNARKEINIKYGHGWRERGLISNSSNQWLPLDQYPIKSTNLNS